MNSVTWTSFVSPGETVWPPNTSWTRNCPVVFTVTFIIALRGEWVRRPPQLRLVEAQARTGVAEHEAVALVLGIHELHLLEIGRAQGRSPVTNEQLVCGLLLVKKKE